MMTWVYALPAWLVMPGVVLVSCILATMALSFTRTRLTRNELITHNDVAGAVLATLGTILAVMMSFMVVGVWEQYDAAGQNTQAEASALSDLHHLADGLPAPARTRIQQSVNRYLLLLLNEEWPEMRHGGESLRAHTAAYQIEREVTSLHVGTPAASLIQTQALEYTTRFLDARRQRIRDNLTGIPNVLWSAMLFLGAITIAFSFYFKVDRPIAQYIMVMTLTAVISLIFGVIAELDYPFRGDVAIQPDAYVHVYNTLHHIGFQT